MCNSCCAETYKKKFMTSLNVKKPYLSDTLPEPPTLFNISENQTEDEYINEIIRELTQPHYHRSKKCIFCKEKIEEFKLIYSI